jgi:hypothetical protein
LSLDYATLEKLRENNPAWRLLCADQAALVASFLDKVFITPNVRIMSQADLVEALEDELYSLRESRGPKAFPKSALAYLNDWAANDKGWLRKFYKHGTDEPHFDLTPSTEKAISWLKSLSGRAFVGTESRLLTLFELLKQMSDGSQSDPQVRIAELKNRQVEINAELARLEAGEIDILNDTALKDRFQQFNVIARELLTDFREVEHNFRGLDRRVREHIALWEGSKGALLDEIMGEREAIADSDQGRSFRAFWDLLMSSRRQEELTQRLEQILKLPAIAELHPDMRLQRIHYDWLEAGEHTQRTVAMLSQQLRRFLDDTTWLENKRIMEILHGIEAKALSLRNNAPEGDITSIACADAEIELPMERPLAKPTVKIRITETARQADESDVDTKSLFAQSIVDKRLLAANIRKALQERPQITLSDLVSINPLNQGLSELVAYIQLANDSFETVVDENIKDSVVWYTEKGNKMKAYFERLIFVRKA